ncbi:hypothetical protein RhiirC2_713918 [Rhizophagus irregularis]|uniref:Uncharacterized protein n=1 Tax=Rhizophagus irregularis TaxID=588596 RepID=A0A2N1N1F2_9GLOM|nr:hypothetical protein RhiirC2_713918 [Rhizophagus irregularis]
MPNCVLTNWLEPTFETAISPSLRNVTIPFLFFFIGTRFGCKSHLGQTFNFFEVVLRRQVLRDLWTHGIQRLRTRRILMVDTSDLWKRRISTSKRDFWLKLGTRQFFLIRCFFGFLGVWNSVFSTLATGIGLEFFCRSASSDLNVWILFEFNPWITLKVEMWAIFFQLGFQIV